MALTSSIAMALASPNLSLDFPRGRDNVEAAAASSGDKQLAGALPTPPNSISPNLPAHVVYPTLHSPPPINIEYEMDMIDEREEEEGEDRDVAPEDTELPPEPAGTPLSRGALSGLDASAAITPAMLAKHHLPAIMLGNGPRPIRYVMGELTHSVPGFSRIPPAKARRLVVAALESRHGGGPDGSVTFSKTGWGRWDAHIKGSSKDSGIGSFQDGHMSPPRSERSSYAVSNGDSAMHMPGHRLHSAYCDHVSGDSWTASSLREEDELELDMDEDDDVPENEADKMSLDGQSAPADDNASSSMNDDTDDEDWAAVGPAALRKASLPTPGAPRLDYNAISIPGHGPSRSWSRRPSAMANWRFPQSTSFPQQSGFADTAALSMDPSLASPEERAAVAALLSLGSM
ncbi:putative Sin3 binding protein-domain-containing protein [Neohortaea acidophila]|uniref:Putative Sin3 binding protein-domain-containing protein n=1 Tax=Neohortaea acidophila TaxID=245834 RepID=A0A6A6Q1S6_9PEZI|nr:putative Sin3 binding protein-domain-containing protein [Neohortaea acidophila]KAF2486438.1 putative Sin3 binding protein-domain-containing protein [Neohortaea acidophila]